MALRILIKRLAISSSSSFNKSTSQPISLLHTLNNSKKFSTITTKITSNTSSSSVWRMKMSTTAMEEIKIEEKQQENIEHQKEELQDTNSTDNTKKQRIITPPICKEMFILDESAFEKEFSIPVLVVKEDERLFHTMKILKEYFLKSRNFKGTIVPVPEEKIKKIYLHPDKLQEYKNIEDFVEELRTKISTPDIIQSFHYETVKLTYDNWTYDEVLNSILPDDKDKVGGFSKIGHILHLNLRDHHLPYKHVIGKVLLDKVPGCKTVVNKTDSIDNTYRNFQLEILAGEDNTVVQAKEARCEFEFDFAKVYWNPRLGTEHERIVSLLKAGDTLYDVFAGVGPFTVPAGKKKVRVLANDLNPESFKWLEHNVKKNKVVNYVQTFNQDGRDFIRTVVKKDLQEKINAGETQNVFHVSMNLPAMAVEFLDAFWNLLDDGSKINNNLKINIHVYCFIKSDLEDFKERALELVKEKLNYDLQDEHIQGCYYVRLVAPKKEMRRISFLLPHEILTQEKPSTLFQSTESNVLKRKFSEISEEVSSVG